FVNANYSQLVKNKQNNQKRHPDFESELVEKHAHMEHANEIAVEKNTCEIGIQTNEIGVQVNKETREIGIQAFDNMSHTLENYIHLLQAQLDIKINEIETLQKQLEYAYDYIIKSWEQIQEINQINKELSEQNNILKYKWENHYNNQKKRIDSVIQIANYECQNVYDDIKSLILNKQQFSLSSLLNFVPET
ncbi:990_t:CDS:1, partial [Racocetra fulgida]